MQNQPILPKEMEWVYTMQGASWGHLIPKWPRPLLDFQVYLEFRLDSPQTNFESAHPCSATRPSLSYVLMYLADDVIPTKL